MPVLDKPELLQWPTHRIIGKQKCSRRRDFKVFGHHIFVYQAVRKTRPVPVYLFGIAAAYILIFFVVLAAVISRMAMVGYSVGAVFLQNLHFSA